MAFHINPETGNPGVCRAKIKCRFGLGSDAHYETAQEAMAAYEGQEVKSASLRIVVDHNAEETSTTPEGNTYSKITKQPDGSFVQSINGQTVVVGPKDEHGFHSVYNKNREIGSLEWKKGKWAVSYSDGSNARSKKSSVDAMQRLLKRANPPAREKKEAGPAKGYNPEHSELDLYGDFHSNKDRTVGNLRRMNNRDLVQMYNSLEYSISNGHYSNEIQSDSSAQKRIQKVLSERGESLEIGRYGKLQPGSDYGDPSTYRLRESK